MENQEFNEMDNSTLNELKAQTELLKQLHKDNIVINRNLLSIKNNVKFFFWLTLITIIIYGIVLFFAFVFSSQRF
jgi:hypothetical protein